VLLVQCGLLLPRLALLLSRLALLRLWCLLPGWLELSGVRWRRRGEGLLRRVTPLP
jgi:hypothetical protein